MEEEKKIEKLENNILNEKAILEHEKEILASKKENQINNLENNVINEKRVIIEKDFSGEREIIEERKKKIIHFLKNDNWIILGIILLFIVLFGVYVRTLPMSDHSKGQIPSFFNFLTGNAFEGRPGLWDITTNTWTLGPDLDPYLFLRYAKTIHDNGSLPEIDPMRNVPLGFPSNFELPIVSYAIYYTHKIVNIFGDYNLDFAGVFTPVLAFILIILAFFFFVREIFVKKDDKKSKNFANIIAIISTLFMIVIPEFLSRTVAGIPEKESIAFFFMFLTFYLFLKAWKSEKIGYAATFAILSGISTALMGLTWAGVIYIYVTISVAVFTAFLLNKIKRKETLVYVLWIIFSVAISFSLTTRYSLKGFLTSIDSGLASLILFILPLHYLLWNTKLKDNKYLNKLKLPKNIITLIIAIVLGLVLITLFMGPSFFVEKAVALNQQFFKPSQGRWVTTVAENRQPYFTEWRNSFGPMLGNFPVLFWLFLAGSIVLFRVMIEKLKRKDANILTGAYVIFLVSLIFSRYSSASIFNGENFISKLIYYAAGLILAGSFVYYYIKYYKENDKSLETIDFSYLFLFVLLILCLFTARSSVRLVMVLATVAPILMAFLAVQSYFSFNKSEDSTKKTILLVIAIILGILVIYAFINFYGSVKVQSYNHAPYYYTIQWQKAMGWVRNETPTNSVFVHWWDYGYWLQSIGNRATVTDGGNAIVYWNYLTGRYLLTGDNQKEALDLLYSHNVTHLLIDSSDIGKYGAFSQIGSDRDLDRLSQGPVALISDPKQVQETKNELIRNYNIPAGQGMISLIPFEEDIIYNNNGTTVNIYKENSALMGINIKYQEANNSYLFQQPEAIVRYQNQQIVLPMRYLYFNGKFKDFQTGINATAYLIQRIYYSENGLEMDNIGAMIYLSPRIMRGLLGQLYVLNDPFKKFTAFKEVYNQPDYILEQINSQAQIPLGEFTYYEGLRGPIKIWNVTYTGNEKFNPEFVQKEFPSYIDWKF